MQLKERKGDNYVKRGFNTVNGIRVHAIRRIVGITGIPFSKFQYRKRYKGACNQH